jgi:hypothetical protein
MSTKIGVISEGPIDHVLLPPLLSHIARTDAGCNWPVEAGDVAEPFQIRKRGHGGVLETVAALIEFLKKDPLGYSFVVIVLDRRTIAVQDEIRRLVAGNNGFIVGIAIEEIEAWWLGDRTNTLAWSRFTHKTLPVCRYRLCDQRGRLIYAAEKDPEPKKTLDEITEHSQKLEFRYGDGNTELASQFAEDHWKPNARLNEISSQCPTGFGEFRKHVRQGFRASRQRNGFLI